MGPVNRKHVLEVFKEYVGNYDLADPKIKLKVSHTIRVSELAERIARSIGLSDDEAGLAWLIGMLHDVGRFEQLKQYGTFSDAQSVDHAHCGAVFLFEQGHIRDYIEDPQYDRIICTAIDNHSLYRLPKLEGELLQYCSLLRDADKIDILKVNVEESLEDIYSVTSEEIAHAQVSDGVMQAFLERHAVNHALKKTVIDHSVGHASLVFELVYPISIQIVREQGYLQKILGYVSENEKTREQYAVLRECMEEFLAQAQENQRQKAW